MTVVVEPDGEDIAVLLVLKRLYRDRAFAASVEVIPQELGTQLETHACSAKNRRYLQPLEDNVDFLVSQRLHVALDVR